MKKSKKLNPEITIGYIIKLILILIIQFSTISLVIIFILICIPFFLNRDYLYYPAGVVFFITILIILVIFIVLNYFLRKKYPQFYKLSWF